MSRAHMLQMPSNTSVKRSSASDGPLEDLLPDSDFAFVKEAEGRTVRRFPLTSPDNFVTAIRGLDDATDLSPHEKAAAASNIRAKLSGSIGSRVAAALAERDLATLAALESPGDLRSHSKGTIEVGPSADAIAQTLCLHPDSEGPSLIDLDIDGIDGTVSIRNISDAEVLDDWVDKHSEALSEWDKRNIALSVRATYEAAGYDLETRQDMMKVSSTTRRYGGVHERVGAREAILEDRRAQLSRRNLRVKVSEAIDIGKSSYDAIFSGGLEVAEIAAQVSELDKELGVHTSLPAYTTLFRGIGERADDHDTLFGTTEDDEVLTDGITRIKVRDLKMLSHMNLRRIERWLGPELTQRLKRDPVATYKALDATAQKAILSWTFDRTRGAEKDQGLV